MPTNAPAQPRDDLREQATLYLSAFVVSVTAVWVVVTTLQMVDLRPFILALAFGFAVSWLLRDSRSFRQASPLITVALGAALWLRYRAAGDFLGQPLAEAIGLQAQLGTASLLCGFIIARSFALARVEDLLFSVVPSLATFGIIASVTADPRFITAFVVFIFASAYLAGQAHLVAQRRRVRALPAGGRRREVGGRGLLLAGLLAAALGLAVPGSRLLLAVTPQQSYVAQALTGSPRPQSGGAPAAGGRGVWSSMTSLQVGAGPIRLSPREVMRVTCTEPLLWRAASLARYTDAGWEPSLVQSATIVLAADARGVVDLRPLVNVPRGRVLRQRIQPLQPMDAIFGAMQPVSLRLSDGAAQGSAVRVDAAGTIQPWSRSAAAYEVESQLDDLAPTIPSSVLAPSDPELLRLPPLHAQEITAFARRAVGTATNPRAVVAAITAYLQSATTYTLDAPATPAGEDPVIYFLSRSRKGYCDLYASAAALMLRAQGLPARVAIGYAAGVYDPVQHNFGVRESDAHAWVEVYLPGAGWTIVDPTPAGPDTGPEGAPTTHRRRWWARWSSLIWRNLQYVLLAAAAFALLAWSAKTRWLDPHLARRRRERMVRPDDYRAAVILNYEKLLGVMAKRGLVRRPAETPREFARRLARGPYVVTLMPIVNAATEDYVAARFSEREISPQQAQATRQAVTDMTRGLRRLKEVR